MPISVLVFVGLLGRQGFVHSIFRITAKANDSYETDEEKEKEREMACLDNVQK